MKFKPLITALSKVLLFGCSESDWEDWSDFEAFKIKDENGEKIDCGALVSTSMERDLGYTEYLHDYLYERQYEFSQCGAEVGAHIDSYCTTRAEYAAEYHLGQNSRWSRPNAFDRFCRRHLVAEFAKIDSRYELPSEKIDYIILHDEGAMLKPQSITKISFYEAFQDALWVIKLRTSDESVHALYFGSREKWERAKMDFAQTTSTTRTDERLLGR